MDLISVLYVSSMRIVYSKEEIATIVQKFIEANRIHNITGMLLYSNGSIMQYIEGEKKDIERLYNNIKKDSIHTNIITLLYENITKRIFPEWCLSYRIIPEHVFNIRIKIMNNFIKSNITRQKL